MTREEKAQEFARNCAEYNNLPIEVEHLLHTAFIVGYNEREDEEKNPWHKVSEGFPKEEAFLVRKIDNPQVYAILIYSHKNNGFWNTITGGFNTIDGVLEYYTHWMYIPKLPKED